MQSILRTLDNPKEVFEGDTDQVLELRKRIYKEQAIVHTSTLLLTAGSTYLFRKLLPKPPQLWLRALKSVLLTTGFVLLYRSINPLLMMLVYSKEIGEEAQSILCRHAQKLDCDNIQSILRRELERAQ